MNLYLRLFGGALVMLAALFVGREYSHYADKRTRELRGFLSLISYAESQISKFLASGDGLFRGFENEALESCGFLPAIREGRSLPDAFEACKSRLSLSLTQKAELSDFFSDFGSDYKEGELQKISLFLEKFSKKAEHECEDMTKNVQVARALLLGGALWAGIMAL